MLTDVADLGGILAGAAALIVLGASMRGWFVRTLGRRRDRYERLARLGTGGQLSFFIAVLGEPPAIKRSITGEADEWIHADDDRYDPALVEWPDEEGHNVTVERTYTECLFIDRDYYVQTISDADETVVAFSVTTRRPRFKPVFEMPPRPNLLTRLRWQREAGEKYPSLFRIRLGHTRFSELDPPSEEEFMGPALKVLLGARYGSYSESDYFGNPGYYQTYVFTAGGAGHRRRFGDLGAVSEEVGEAWPGESSRGWSELTAVPSFRLATAITTYTVIGPLMDSRKYPTWFGPHGDEVRTLP